MRRISGQLQHYAWGHPTAIAELRGVEPSGRPEAEYWFGAHPRSPSTLIDAADPDSTRGVTLDAAIAGDPDYWLGPSVRDRFGELPFLLKILAADQPLSIQAHPDQARARAGFEREERAGIDRDAFKRSYRDPNHKPELICALSRFEAKCGLRELDDTRRLISLFADPLLQPLRDRLGENVEPSEVLASVVSWLLKLDERTATTLVDAVVAGADGLLDSPEPASEVERFRSELEWTIRINDHHPGDVGVVVALLLNHVVLEPGQALFLGAGVLHAYLSGVGVELMANSDNVLRGGLTPKHIDVHELLAVASFEPFRSSIQTMTDPVHRFEVPVPEFRLTGYRFASGAETHRCAVSGPEIVLVGSGSAVLRADTTDDTELRLAGGEAAIVPAATEHYQLELATADTTVWRATTGS